METKVENSYTLLDVVSTVQYWISFLLSKWLLLLVFATAGAGIGVLYAWLKKPVYTAEIVYVAENDNQGTLGGYAGIAAQFGLDMGMSGNGAFTGENLAEFLKSRASVERALLSNIVFKGKEMLLIDYYLHANQIDKALAAKKLLGQVNFHSGMEVPNRVRDSVLTKIEEDIKTELTIDKKDKKLDYYSAKIKDGDEFFAKTFLESLTSTAIIFYVNYKSEKARQNVEILQHTADSVRRTLYGNIEQVAAGTDLNVNPIRQVARTGVQRSQVNMQVSSAIYGEIVKNLELSKIALRRETPFIQIIDAPKFPLDKEKPGRLKTSIISAFLFGFLFGIFLILKRLLTEQKKIETSAD